MYLDAIQFKVRDGGHVKTSHLPGDCDQCERAERSVGLVDRAAAVLIRLQAPTSQQH